MTLKMSHFLYLSKTFEGALMETIFFVSMFTEDEVHLNFLSPEE